MTKAMYDDYDYVDDYDDYDYYVSNYSISKRGCMSKDIQLRHSSSTRPTSSDFKLASPKHTAFDGACDINSLVFYKTKETA